MADKKLLIKIGVKGGRKATQMLGSVTGALGKMTKWGSLAGIGIAGLSVKMAGDFSKSLREVGTLMKNVTEKDLKNMSKELRQVAASSGLALDSLAKAKYDIVSAGFSDAASSAQVLATASKLAVGGVTSAASAADILTSTLNAYQLSSSKANKVADILFTTVRFGKTTMDELSSSLGRVLPLTNSAGLSLEGVGAAMATITAGGINTAEATTALGGAMKALAAPTKRARKEMKLAGVEVKRFDDGSMDLIETIRQFRGKDLAAIRLLIPDVTAATAILSMANNFEKLVENVDGFADSAGAADTAFDEMQKAFNTKMARLKEGIGGGMIELGTVIIEKITPAVDAANDYIEKIGDIGWDVVAERFSDNFGLVTDAILGTFGVLASMLSSIIGLAISGAMMDMSWGMKQILGVSDESLADWSNQSKDRLNNFGNDVGAVWQNVLGKLTKPVDVEPEGNLQKFLGLDDFEFQALELEQLIADWKANQFVVPDEPPITDDDLFDPEAFEEQSQGELEANQRHLDEKIAQMEAHQALVKKREHTERKGKLNHISELAGSFGALNTATLGSAVFSGRMAQAQAILDTYAGASKALSAGIPPWNFIAAASVVASGLANVAKIEEQTKKMQSVKAATGYDDIVNAPTMFLAGEAGAERVSVTPLEGPNINGPQGGNVNITFTGNVTSQEFIENDAIPQIKEAIRRGADIGVG